MHRDNSCYCSRSRSRNAKPALFDALLGTEVVRMHHFVELGCTDSLLPLHMYLDRVM